MELSTATLIKDIENDPSSERATKPIVFLTFFSSLGGFLFGYHTGVVSGAMILIREQFGLTDIWQEIIVSVAILTAWFSSLTGGFFADHFGRRSVILGSSFIFTVGALVLGFAPNKEMLLIGRIIVGLGIGSSSMCVPMYISEVAPLSLRGSLTVTNSLFITGGQFIASVICGSFSGLSEGWRWMLGIAALPSLIQFIAFIFAPESPRWLTLHGRLEDAKTVLQKFRSHQAKIDDEVEEFRTSQKNTGNGKFGIFHSGPVRRALIVGCSLQFFQQISGINTVMYYGASIIAMAGVRDHQTAIWLAAVTTFFNFISNFISLWLVEKLGRRRLTLGSLVGVTFSLLLLAISFQLNYNYSPSVMNINEETLCSKYKFCSECVDDQGCGFCFQGTTANYSYSSCLPTNHYNFNEVSTTGLCDQISEYHTFAKDWCPSNFSWFAILALCLYLFCFSSGIGPMPWSINSEIYPNWARARCTSIATSVNWGANLFVSLTFLTLTDAITKQGAFYLYTGFCILGFISFFLILPETKGVGLENVELLFEKPLCKSTPWKTSNNLDIKAHKRYETM